MKLLTVLVAFPVTMIKDFDQSRVGKGGLILTHQSIMVEQSLVELDQLVTLHLQSRKREPQMLVFRSQGREWCLTQWVDLPTSKAYQDNPYMHAQRLIS